MCAGAIVLALIDRVVFGAWDEKAAWPGRSATPASSRLNIGRRCREGARGGLRRLVREFFVRSARSLTRLRAPSNFQLLWTGGRVVEGTVSKTAYRNGIVSSNLPVR